MCVDAVGRGIPVRPASKIEAITCNRSFTTMSTITKTEERPVSKANDQRTIYVTPRANIYETKDGYVLQAEMPGVTKDGIEISVENNELTIIGRRANVPVSGDWVYRESRPNDYRRVFELDPSIDTVKVTAKMEQGLLTLELPKAERVKPRKITVA
jgi:HSP20 family protein